MIRKLKRHSQSRRVNYVDDFEYDDWFKMISAIYKEGYKQGDPDRYYEEGILWSMKSAKHHYKEFDNVWKSLSK